MAGKFDDLEKFLKAKRKPLKPEAKGKKGMFDGMVKKTPEGMNPEEIIEQLESVLGKGMKELGFDIGKIKAVKPSELADLLKGDDHKGHEHRIAGLRSSTDTRARLAIDKLVSTFEGMMMVMEGLLVKSGAVPSCEDANGNSLKVGDVLDAGNEKTKTVLALGYGYCRLSHTDDQTEDDSYWFQAEIKKQNFVIKK